MVLRGANLIDGLLVTNKQTQYSAEYKILKAIKLCEVSVSLNKFALKNANNHVRYYCSIVQTGNNVY